MSWTIERRGRVAVVTMTTNPVNAQNRAFFADLHEAFDRLERDHAESPVVLTGTGTRFSAGLDLGEHFPLFAGDPAAVASWFRDYRATNMRLFTYPRPTVAAVNGHAFAGGLITAAVCDHRVAVADGARFGLNEVPIGIPMPAVYVRMLAYAWGEPVAARTCLLGEVFSPAQAHALGMVHELVPAGELLDRAVAIAERTPEDCLGQYAFTKRACQAAALRDIAELADPLDSELPDGMTSDQARHAHRRYWQQLKGSPGAVVSRTAANAEARAASRRSGAGRGGPGPSARRLWREIDGSRRRAAPGLGDLAAQAVSRRQPAPAARAPAGPRRQRVHRPRGGDSRLGTRAHRARRAGREHPLALRPRRGERAAPGDGRRYRGQRPGRRRPSPGETRAAAKRSTSTSPSPRTTLTSRSTTGRSSGSATPTGKSSARPGTPPATCRCGSRRNGCWWPGTHCRTTTSAG